MGRPIAKLNWSLDVECPNCDADVDLTGDENDCEGDISGHIFNNQWEHLKDWEVSCPHCGLVFEIAGVEY